MHVWALMGVLAVGGPWAGPRVCMGGMPSGQTLCDTIVDADAKDACLTCFLEAGTLLEVW